MEPHRTESIGQSEIRPSYGFTLSPHTVKEMMECRRQDLSIGPPPGRAITFRAFQSLFATRW